MGGGWGGVWAGRGLGGGGERWGGGGERLRHSDETTNSAAKAWTECLCADTSRDTGFMVSL